MRVTAPLLALVVLATAAPDAGPPADGGGDPDGGDAAEEALARLLRTEEPDKLLTLEVVWQGPGEPFPVRSDAFARVEEEVWLSPLAHFRDGTCAARGGGWVDETGKPRVCDADESAFSHMRATWFRVTPSSWRVDRSPRGMGPPLAFRLEEWAALKGDRPVLAEPGSGPSDDLGRQGGPGTTRYALRLESQDGRVLGESPGLSDAARARVVRTRSYDDMVGVVEELRNVPYVDSPRGAPPARHETEMALGVDAVTPILYAARRTGLAVGYVDLSSLTPHVRTLVLPRDKVRRGDIVIMGAVVGLLARDAGRPGVLDGPDEVVVALDAPLRTYRLSQLPSSPLPTVLRLKGAVPSLPRPAGSGQPTVR
jgi:hypothetical protein